MLRLNSLWNPAPYLLILAILLIPVLQGCGGGGADIQANSTTVGQQLIDLDKAYKQGVITKDEYDDQKEKILEGD